MIAAYDAPFPDETYKEGARQFPLLVPTSPSTTRRPSPTGRRGRSLRQWEKPFLTAFSDSDPITGGGDRVAAGEDPRGRRARPHTTIEGGGHFLQEDAGEELARVVVEFVGAHQPSGSTTTRGNPLRRTSGGAHGGRR